MISVDDQKALYDGLVSRARQVGEAAGGFLGLGKKVSAPEEQVLSELESILSVN